MRHIEQDRVLQEILSEDGLSSFRESSLVQGLVAVRRERRRRRTLRVLGLVLPLVLVIGISLGHRASAPKPRIAKFVRPPEAGTRVKIISDEELFALFPNRPMALIGKPGHQQLVFFDQPGVRRQ